MIARREAASSDPRARGWRSLQIREGPATGCHQGARGVAAGHEADLGGATTPAAHLTNPQASLQLEHVEVCASEAGALLRLLGLVHAQADRWSQRPGPALKPRALGRSAGKVGAARRNDHPSCLRTEVSGVRRTASAGVAGTRGREAGYAAHREVAELTRAAQRRLHLTLPAACGRRERR